MKNFLLGSISNSSNSNTFKWHSHHIS
jgi:hypothetical protein